MTDRATTVELAEGQRIALGCSGVSLAVERLRTPKVEGTWI